LIEQAMEYRPTVCLGEIVQTLEPLKGHHPEEPHEVQGVLALGGTVYKIKSDLGVHYTRTLIISAGAGAFSPKKLGLKEAAEFENEGVYYSCKSKSVFADKRVLIAGGGDSAIDWAMNLREITRGGDGSGITLIHRRNQFRAHEEAVRRLQATKVKILTFCEIEKLVAEDGVLRGVVIYNSHTKEKCVLEADAILVQFGFNSSLGPIEHWPLAIEKRKAIAVNRLMETELPGVFAVGDVSTFEGKLKLIVTGFGEAATAVNVAKTRIDPHAKIFPGHSSEMTSAAESVVVV
jgi:thioredoxin reductase (NADPH)